MGTGAQATSDDRGVPGWLSTAGWVALGASAVGLPTALLVAGLDTVLRTGTTLAQRTVVAALVVLAIGGVVAVERGVTWAVREQGAGAALTYLGIVVGLVVLGVLVPPLGLVLVALGVVVGLPLALGGIGYLAYWRWRNGPRPSTRTPRPTTEVRQRAEARRQRVRRRHDATRDAVAAGLIGPGFIRDHAAGRARRRGVAD